MGSFPFPLIEKENILANHFFQIKNTFSRNGLSFGHLDWDKSSVWRIKYQRNCYLCPLFHLPVPWISSLVFFNFSSQHFVIAFEYLNCCGIFEEFQLEFRSQKQQASSIVFENAFKLLLGNRSFKILITKQLVFRN